MDDEPWNLDTFASGPPLSRSPKYISLDIALADPNFCWAFPDVDEDKVEGLATGLSFRYDRSSSKLLDQSLDFGLEQWSSGLERGLFLVQKP